MWKCLECNAVNEGEECSVCGKTRTDNIEQTIRTTREDIKKAFDGGVTVNYKLPVQKIEPETEKNEEKEEKKKPKTLIICLISVVAVIVFALGGLLGVYFSALGDYAGGDFEKASRKFSKISFFLNSKDKMEESIYENALFLFEDENYLASKAEFERVLSFKDASKMIFECDYNMLLVYKEQGDYKSASKMLLSMAEDKKNENIKEIEMWCNYAYAESMIESEPDEARALLKDLDEDYENTKELILECTYRIAKQYEADGEYEKAYEEFSNCLDYKDSEYLQSSLRGRVLEKAIELYDDGDYEKSSDLLKMCESLLEDEEKIAAYELFLRYKDKNQKPETHDRLFSYLDSYTAARKIVTENKDVFCEFITGTWEENDKTVLSLGLKNIEYSDLFGLNSGKYEYKDLKIFVGSKEVVYGIEIIGEDRIKICLTDDRSEHILTRR